MKKILFLLLILFSGKSFGNVDFIEFDKIPSFEKYTGLFSFLSRNVQYYGHWQPDWPFDVNKNTLVEGLEDISDTFSNLDSENIEIALLLGDISHYLWNLGENKYCEIAEEYYKKAIELAPNDYRPYWFIANHYASSNVQDRFIEFFLKAQSLLPTDKPAAFWEEYAYATAMANMPSHCIYAMDRAKKILGEPGYFETQVGQTIYDRILPVKSDSSYSYVDIWTASQGDSISFICRPLGIKLLIDSTWQIEFGDYRDHHSFVVIVPPAITSKEGRDITYTIALFIRVAQKGDDLTGYIDGFISKFLDKEKFNFSDKYPEMIAFEVKDKSMYQDIGGLHGLVIGVKRDKPQYAGLLLEEPMTLPKEKAEKKAIYRWGKSMARFDDVIYYAIMLDACEDIYSDAYSIFKDVFEKQITIE